MKQNNYKIFTTNKILRATIMACMAICITFNANAAIDLTGCEDENNNVWIDPTLALCSVHAYNIGATKNPENEAEKQLIQNAVALKTTLITQQMYAQYAALETTIKRLKTQLQKEILLAKLEAAGAKTKNSDKDDDSSSSGGSSSGTSLIADDEDCRRKSTPIEGLECIQEHIGEILGSLKDGNLSPVRKQLEKEINAFKTWTGNKQELSKECKRASSRKDIETCAYSLNTTIGSKISDLKDKQSNKEKD